VQNESRRGLPHVDSAGRAQQDVGVCDSRALAKNLADNPIYAVALDDAIPCIRVQWRSYATSTQLRFVHESLIGLIERHRVSNVLGDDTALVCV
jgi:hypothetical protein